MKTAYAGQHDKADRSDCMITLSINKDGGRNITVNSKVKLLFEQAIRKTLTEGLDTFSIEHADLIIDDNGAPDYVIMARLEACVKKIMDTDIQFLPEMLSQNLTKTSRDRMRRSRLYLPGNTPKLALNAGLHKGDGIILDLEDSVSPDRKDEARILVRNSLRAVDFYGAERMVRINQGERGLEDLDAVIPQHANVILLPKCETPEQLLVVDKRIQDLRKKHGIKEDVWIMPIIESALGVIKAYDIAASSKNIVGLAIGLEDYTADIGAPRTREGVETFFARGMLVNAAKANGIQAIDSVFSDVGDMEALRNNVLASKALGFDGMGCIHPRQIEVIHEAFAPTEKEIDKARKIVIAFKEAEAKGLGVVSVGSKMIDPPVVKRALRIMELSGEEI